MGIGLDPWLKKPHTVMNWAVDPRGFEKGNAHGRYTCSSPGLPLSLPQLTHPHPRLPPSLLGSAPLGEDLTWLQYPRLMEKDPAG